VLWLKKPGWTFHARLEEDEFGTLRHINRIVWGERMANIS